MDPTTTFLTCVRCRQPTRPFHESVLEGKLEMSAETPFTARLAYKCKKCDRIFCALCCHSAALVKEMLQPGRFSLPEEFTGPHPQAACPECRARVRPYDTIDAEFDDGMDDVENKPVTPGQRIFSGLFAVPVLVMAWFSLTSGGWIWGGICLLVGGGLLWMAVFSK